MKPRITKKRFRDCEFEDWKRTRVLEITFKQWDERVVTQVKDTDWMNNKAEKILIESLRWEAQKYFDNLNAEKSLIDKKD